MEFKQIQTRAQPEESLKHNHSCNDVIASTGYMKKQPNQRPPATLISAHALRRPLDHMAVLEWLEVIAATQPAVLVAVGAGLVGLLVAFCFAQRTSASSSKEKEERREEEDQEEGGGGAGEEKEGGTKPKKTKVKNAPKAKRTTLPSHPLLAADFKGHTGAVLSLDFDSSGKYLVSCSEGDCLQFWMPLSV